ncbi:MAG: hypothetical protein HFE80_11380 [Clostridiaceae bacterium]|jgi:hypothetical protein|nr:hypothetical protein [Clostridiaceae bacterium]
MEIVKMLTALTLCATMSAAAGVGAMPADTFEAAEIEVETAEAAVVMNTATVNGVTWYLVENEACLRAIGVGEYGLDKNYMQNADIAMSKTEWTPIGTESNPFTGQYNGNGYEIKGLTMTSPTVKIIGFFGFAGNAQLYNITLRDLDIETAGGQGKSVGAICARATDCNIHSNKAYSIYDETVASGSRGGCQY